MSQSPTPPVALRALGLTKDYGDRPALAPLDLEIAAGERVALVGHNGSGKTTFLRMAAGLLEPSAGEVRVGSARAGSLLARRAVSWLPDSPTFYDDLSLWEHLEYVARLHGVIEWAERAEHLVERLGVSHRRDDLPTTFSRGLRQKSSIALGLVRPCDVLLVDEPFVGLDTVGKDALLGLLDDAAAAGTTLVVATHELGFLDRVARVVALRDGVVVYDGPPGGADVEGLVSPG
ncbi:MAG: ABC transporter ATP-binding protein [Ilumatobacteraceae bacterium]